MKEKLSIVDDTWDFICMWYTKEDAICEVEELFSDETPDSIVQFLHSGKFLKWSVMQYRTAMFRGAGLMNSAMLEKAKRQAEEKSPLGERDGKRAIDRDQHLGVRQFKTQQEGHA